MFTVFVRTSVLTDRSEVYNVVLVDREEATSPNSRAVMEFNAVSFGDAYQLRDALCALLLRHTVNEVSVREV